MSGFVSITWYAALSSAAALTTFFAPSMDFESFSTCVRDLAVSFAWLINASSTTHAYLFNNAGASAPKC